MLSPSDECAWAGGVGLLAEYPHSLAMSAVSSTFRAHDGMHSEKSAISLSMKLLLLLCLPRLARNQFRSGTQSDPSISSIATSIMIPTSNSPAKGSGMPNHYVGDYCTPWGFPGSPACEPNFLICS